MRLIIAAVTEMCLRRGMEKNENQETKQDNSVLIPHDISLKFR